MHNQRRRITPGNETGTGVPASAPHPALAGHVVQMISDGEGGTMLRCRCGWSSVFGRPGTSCDTLSESLMAHWHNAMQDYGEGEA